MLDEDSVAGEGLPVNETFIPALIVSDWMSIIILSDLAIH